MGLPLSNDGKPVPSQAGSRLRPDPEGRKERRGRPRTSSNILIQPKVCNEYLKTGLGRSLPAMPSIVKNDPWWLDPKDPHRVAYVKQGLLGPTVPHFLGLQPGLCPGPERARLAARRGSTS